MKTLILVDLQNDFIDGIMGNDESRAIIEPLCDFIKSWKGNIIVTMDTHGSDYLDTLEGKHLPVPHCIKPTRGWMLNDNIAEAVSKKPNVKYVEKSSFGHFYWDVDDDGEFVLCGLMTDICVINNAFIIKNLFRNREVNVIADLCAGTTPSNHEQALNLMKVCQVNIL